MSEHEFDICGIGNAIVDILSFTTEETIAASGLAKGSMGLVSQAQAADIYKLLGSTTECSGGSVANSLAGMASLGAKAAFIGTVAKDQLGGIFTHDMQAIGVHFSSTQVENGPATAHCMVMVTPDAQRTMATFLGACGLVSEADIDASLIERSAITYIEGYLWDADHAKAAIRKAIRIARGAGRKVALTLSDTFCVDRHRAEFLQLVSGGVDILFANEAEICALYQTEDFDEAISRLRGSCSIAAVTRSEKGSVIVTTDSVETVETKRVANLVDTTGAGDLFAAGFLYGLCKGWELSRCAMLGNACAGHIITQLGARSQKPLQALVA